MKLIKQILGFLILLLLFTTIFSFISYKSDGKYTYLVEFLGFLLSEVILMIIVFLIWLGFNLLNSK